MTTEETKPKIPKIPTLHKFSAKLLGAEPVMDEDGKQVPGMWLTADRGNGRRFIMQEPTIGECAGWKPGHEFKVHSEGGTFIFQRLSVHETTGASHVDCFGGSAGRGSSRSFFPDNIKAA